MKTILCLFFFLNKICKIRNNFMMKNVLLTRKRSTYFKLKNFVIRCIFFILIEKSNIENKKD